MQLLASIGFIEVKTEDNTYTQTDLEKDGVLQITKLKTTTDLNQKTIAKVKAILIAGLYPNVARVSYEARVDAVANPEQKVCVAETPQGPAQVHPSSVNRNIQANGWIVYHDKVNFRFPLTMFV